ncbi:MAG: HEAT repeat domain-containing protein [Polyangia bacterium]
MSVSADSILAAIRQAAAAGYSERLDLLARAAQLTRSFCRKLTRVEARRARAVLVAVLEMPLVGKCALQCCNASYVHAVQLEAKSDVLAAYAHLDADAVIELSPGLLARLAAPESRRIALAAVKLIGRSPEGRRVHAALLLGALVHSRWQVVESAACSLGRLGLDAPDRARGALAQALRHEQWQVRRAAAKALGAITGGRHAALDRAAERDTHTAVRYAACKAIGKKLPWP